MINIEIQTAETLKKKNQKWLYNKINVAYIIVKEINVKKEKNQKNHTQQKQSLYQFSINMGLNQFCFSS